VDMKTRGKRQDEAIQVIRLLMQGGMQEFHGKYFDFDRLTMAQAINRYNPQYSLPDLDRRDYLKDALAWCVVFLRDSLPGVLA